MTAKTERIEMRIDPEGHRRVQEAAAASHEATSDFVRRAALDRADDVLARAEHTIMPAEQFDALLHALDTPEDAPRLARAVAAPRRFARR